MSEDNTYYRETRLINLELGSVFILNQTKFELVYNNHAIMVGVTTEEQNGRRQALSFADDQKVLVQILNPVNHA